MAKRIGEPSPSNVPGRRAAAFSLFHFLFAAAWMIFAAGCAAPSEPTPRHPPVPLAVTDLHVAQQGDRVILTFTMPTKTADQHPITTKPSLEICRKFFAASGTPPDARAVSQQGVLVSVPSAMATQYQSAGHVRLPVEFRSGEEEKNFGAQAAFVVRSRISEKKASDDSNVAVVRVYLPPLPISDLAAQVKQDAVELSWSAATPRWGAGGAANAIASMRYRVYRESKPAQEAAAGAATATLPRFEQLGEAPSPAFRDTAFEFGHTYTYSVRSVVQYSSDPADSVESDDSNLLSVTPKDIFPPAAPQGMVAVSVPATPDTPAHIELSWAISPESDLASYNVYRSEQAGVSGVRLNERPLLTPAYRDMTVAPGRSYTYTVTAVDRAGNESPASEPVTAGMSAAEKEATPQP